MHPFHRAVPVADVDNSFPGIPREEVFERGGVGDADGLSAAKENENTPEVLCDLIGLNVRDFPAEFEGVLTPQIRDTVLKIEIRAGAGKTGAGAIRVAQAGAAAAGETRNLNKRQPAPNRYARVEGIALAATAGSGAQTSRPIGDDVLVADGKALANAVVAEPEFFHQCGTGGPNPI